MFKAGFDDLLEALLSLRFRNCCPTSRGDVVLVIPLPRINHILSLVGGLTMKWNEAELVWFLIYTGLVYQLPRDVAEAIFKRHATGNGQRELILSVARVALKGHPEILQFLDSARKETNNLAIERNDIIHGDYMHAAEDFRTPPELLEVRIAPGGSHTRRKNVFAGEVLDSAIPPLIDDIQKLINQLDHARRHLIWRFLPEAFHPQRLPESMPNDLKTGLLAAHPELAPPQSPLIWTPIRPIARQGT